MSGAFPARWLSMREPYDHAARDPALVARLDDALGTRAVDLVDFGCGLGSNLRYVAPKLRAAQRWTLIDSDPALLDEVPERLSRWAHDRGETVTPTAHGLRIGTRLEVGTACIDLRDEAVAWPEVDVVTTQALLDLVSASWLDRLADHLVRTRTPLLAALTVDGRIVWTPPDPDDSDVNAAFRAHQLTDRGFGASPGPEAAQQLAATLAGRGFSVETRRADWTIGPDPEMLAEMAAGIAGAAAETAAHTGSPDRVHAWRTRRLAAASEPATRLVVGHLDLLAQSIDPR